MLTDLKIKQLKSKKKLYDVYDQRGLFVRVLPSGGKTFYQRYSYDSKQQAIRIGKYPAYSLIEAREKSIDIQKIVEKGGDPKVTKTKVDKKEVNKCKTFDEVAIEYVKRYKKKHNT